MKTDMDDNTCCRFNKSYLDRQKALFKQQNAVIRRKNKGNTKFYPNSRDIMFMAWIENINKLVMAKLDCDLYELPDESYSQMFDDGWKVKDVVTMIVDDYRMF